MTIEAFDDGESMASVRSKLNNGQTALQNWIVASGIAEDAAHFGAFTGPIIAGNLALKPILQALSDAIPSGGGVSDHGALTGLTDDDHTQYALADGTRPFTAPVAGVDPTTDQEFATKVYSDTTGDFQVLVKNADFFVRIDSDTKMVRP